MTRINDRVGKNEELLAIMHEKDAFVQSCFKCTPTDFEYGEERALASQKLRASSLPALPASPKAIKCARFNTL